MVLKMILKLLDYSHRLKPSTHHQSFSFVSVSMMSLYTTFNELPVDILTVRQLPPFL